MNEIKQAQLRAFPPSTTFVCALAFVLSKVSLILYLHYRFLIGADVLQMWFRLAVIARRRLVFPLYKVIIFLFQV